MVDVFGKEVRRVRGEGLYRRLWEFDSDAGGTLIADFALPAGRDVSMHRREGRGNLLLEGEARVYENRQLKV